jgi:DNA invertase Pin-like site-specific DNA recombinase
MQTAIIYCRVSTEDQVHGYSLANQQRDCRRWCTEHDAEVVRVFIDEGASAKTADRPELLKALAYVNRHDVDLMVVYKIDRLARRSADHHTIRASLTGRACRLVSVTEPIEDTPTGRLMESMLAGFAEFDNAVRAERARQGMASAAEAGAWIWRPPVGYRRCRRDGRPSLEPDPVMAPLVVAAFRRYAAGATQKSVIERARAEGLRSSRGKSLGYAAIRHMLENPVYVGILSSTLVDRPTVGTWPGIVDQATWDLVQARLRNSARKNSPRLDDADWPLKGWVTCGHCGTDLRASRSKGRSRHYAYYHCTECKGQRIRADRLHELYLERLAGLTVDPRRAEEVRRVVVQRYRDRQSHIEARAKATRRRVDKIRRDRDRLLDLLVAGTVDEATYNRRDATLRDELAEASLHRDEATAEETDLRAGLDLVLRLLLEPKLIWRKGSHRTRLALQGWVMANKWSWTRDQNFGTAPITSHLNTLRLISTPELKMVEATEAGWNRVDGVLSWLALVGREHRRAS